MIALDLASDCKQNRAWTRAALQDAQLLGKLSSFPEFADIENFCGLFGRLGKISVSSLKNRLKKFLLTRIPLTVGRGDFQLRANLT